MTERAKPRRRGTIAPKGAGRWMVRVSLGRDPTCLTLDCLLEGGVGDQRIDHAAIEGGRDLGKLCEGDSSAHLGAFELGDRGATDTEFVRQGCLTHAEGRADRLHPAGVRAIAHRVDSELPETAIEFSSCLGRPFAWLHDA